MKSFTLILILIGLVSDQLQAEIPAGWSTNYAETLASTESTPQPTLIFFTASWCGPCKLMSHVTLTDPAIAQALSDLKHVAVDIDEHPDVAAKHHVNAVPTFVMVTTAEHETERTTGFQSASDFLHWLTNGVSETKIAMVRQARAQKYLAEVDQLLVSTNSDSMHQAVVKLFDLCDEREVAIVQAAVDHLKTVASRDPAALLDGLNDPRLATRIRVANALRFKIGEAFDFDPWDDAPGREKNIIAWRKKLIHLTSSASP